ncbi:MAG: hypothetical protein PHD81_01830 [Candidatus Nanoarchaeia archaeon]|nr:hypothetical protein [Candidatus Nanoarchaeia archaeon]MDD5587829.1 hypothetical protein [Candidatus Nanoarchaeia archaeon]
MKKKNSIIKTPILKDSEEPISAEDTEQEDNVYNKKEDESLEEEDEIDEVEEGVMEGFDEDIKSVKCAFCHKILTADDKPIEEEIKDVVYQFCSEDHAFKFKKKKK